MNILNIMLGRGRGGIEQASLDYALALHSCGHNVVNVLHPQSAMKHTFAERSLVVTELDNYGAWDILAAYRLRRLCIAHQIDIIISHGNRALNLAHRFLPHHIKLAVVAHNYQLKHFHKAHSALCITQAVKAQLEREQPALRCFYIPNMVEKRPEPLTRSFHQPPRIGVLGRLVAKKGMDVWLHALNDLRDNGYIFDAWIGGEGEQRSELEQLTLTLSLQDCVTFKGWIDDSEAFYDALDIFCLPSHQEPFGIVVIEAMAAGLPVIATRSEGPREIIADDSVGLLVDINDPLSMAEALAGLLDNPQHARTMGASAYSHVMHHFERNVVARTLNDAVQSIIQD